MSDVFSIEIKKGVRVMARWDKDGEMEILNMDKEWKHISDITKSKYKNLKYNKPKK